MSGRRHASFRSGDRAEGLALELLRAFAFVAPVPRPEDVGVDAVATVFRQEDQILHAERSFLVQVKAASQKKVRYVGKEADWLRKLELPLYFLTVEKSTCTANLYCPSRGTRHPNFRDRKEICLVFGDAHEEFRGDGQIELRVGFGPPIMSWTPLDAENEGFLKNAYAVLSRWIELDTLAINSRLVGISSPVTWQTNQVPEAHEQFVIMQTAADMPEILRRGKLLYESLLGRAFLGSHDDVRICLLYLREFMRRNGLDPDPGGVVATLTRQIAEKNQQSTQQPGPLYDT